MKQIRIGRKRLLTPEYGYDRLTPMSPSTLKVEHHDPGGLVWWQDLAEIGINIVVLAGTLVVAVRLDPVFGIVWSILGAFALLAFGSKLRFRLFGRRPAAVTTLYVPATIPNELVERYERVIVDLRQATRDLEEVAASQGIEYGAALRACAEGKE